MPFEPGKRRKAKAESEPTPATTPAPRKLNPLPPSTKAKPAQTTQPDSAPKRVYTRSEMAIPDSVSKRMAKRMAVFCGVPTVLSFASFIGAYFVNTRTEVHLPTVLVFSSSLGFLVLGVLGLSYGVLSSSWDETAPGSLWGIGEFRVNFGRMVEGWRAAQSARNKEKS
nr:MULTISPECIES: PAM68 family protein [unclassified Limnothrix]